MINYEQGIKLLGDKRDLKIISLGWEGVSKCETNMEAWAPFKVGIQSLLKEGGIATHWIVEKAPEFLPGKRLSTVGTGVFVQLDWWTR